MPDLAHSGSRIAARRRRALPRAPLATLSALALAALLSACGAPTTGSSPTATLPPTVAPTATSAPPLAQPFHVPATDTSQLCGGAFGDNAPSVYAFSHTLYAEPAFALSYPSYALPAGVSRQKPFDMGQSINSPDLDQLFGGVASANPSISSPGGVTLTVCNNGAQPETLTGVSAGLIAVTPYSGPVDTWQICDGAYQPGAGVRGGGCGGAVQADEIMRAAFAPADAAGATVHATLDSATGANGYGPLPVTLKPNASILITIAIAMPSAPGTYRIGLSISGGDSTGAPSYAPLDDQLFAPDAHTWNGDNCKASAMQSQIPSNATTSYFICP